MLRSIAAFLLIAGVALGASNSVLATEARPDGEALFKASEFIQAAHTFERALLTDSNSPRLHYWAGRSYARAAEVASLLSARKNARRAQNHLEAAVRLDPSNREYLTELFEFYVDSPEWFGGGLDRAANLLERLGPDDGGFGTPSRRLIEAREEYRGAAWGLEKGVLRTSAAMGRFIPWK